FPPRAQCGPNDPEPPPDPCARVRCAAGTHCEARQVTCVKAPCPPVAECVADPPPADPCQALMCPAGQHCEKQDVVCVRAPCPPVVQCVADKPAPTDACATVRC